MNDVKIKMKNHIALTQPEISCRRKRSLKTVIRSHKSEDGQHIDQEVRETEASVKEHLDPPLICCGSPAGLIAGAGFGSRAITRGSHSRKRILCSPAAPKDERFC